MLFSTSILNNVAAQIQTYTPNDDGSNITITVGQRFNVSVHWSSMWRWILADYDIESGVYDSSVLEVVDSGYWKPDDMWAAISFNLTFEGIKAGNDTIIYNLHMSSDYSIEDSFTLNVTINASNSISLPLIITVFAIIIVVPSALIIKWMKGEEKNEN